MLVVDSGLFTALCSLRSLRLRSVKLCRSGSVLDKQCLLIDSLTFVHSYGHR